MAERTSMSGHPIASRPEDFWALARRIARCGTQGVARIEFLHETSDALREFTGCDCVDFWVTDEEQDYHWHRSFEPPEPASFEPVGAKDVTRNGRGAACDFRLTQAIRTLMTRIADGGTEGGATRTAFCSCDRSSREQIEAARDELIGRTLELSRWPSILLLALEIEAPFAGLVVLKSRREAQFRVSDLFSFEQVAAGIGRAIANRRAQFRLRERIKELTCLHGLAQLVQQHDRSIEAALRAAVDVIPAAMQFPEIAAARIVVDGRAYETVEFDEVRHRLSATIVVKSKDRGRVEVVYLSDHPEFVAGAYLAEESKLIESIARDIALLVERFDSLAAGSALAEQLRHADRLATIGQLAAGVAHELNEPLGNILGFAQLLQRSSDLPEPARRDVEQIVKASMHGREVVRKLLVFARQTQAQRIDLDLNNLIRESLYFLEARCRRGAIDMRLDLAPESSIVSADPSQMTQVLVNLAVNAIQAMPSGGQLTVRTANEGDTVVLSVEDTGFGMDEATKQRLFTPFFTTKDVGEGTGLGLSVVLGIVSAHGGTIHVESAPGRGAMFKVVLPRTTNGSVQPAPAGAV